jgi:hypothetical protein
LAFNTPEADAPAQLSEEIVPTREVTVLLNAQVCPPIESAKVALPIAEGVPVIVYVKVPLPFAKLPGASVAVNPVTPVEVMVWPTCAFSFPPVYGIVLETLEAATPITRAPLLLAEVQFKPVILPRGLTTRVKVQVWPPTEIAKLAVPGPAGVPVIEKFKFPDRGAKVPDNRVAVNPVTPVEMMDCPI